MYIYYVLLEICENHNIYVFGGLNTTYNIYNKKGTTKYCREHAII